MTKSKREFDRWYQHDPTTWSFRVFRKYNTELTAIWDAHILAERYTYSRLGAENAEWSDLPSKYFSMHEIDLEQYTSLKGWSDAFKLFDNWTNLSAILTVASNLETYLSSIISMSLDSDPGVLLGASKAIDGAIVLKHRKPGTFQASDRVEPCIKGDWSS